MFSLAMYISIAGACCGQETVTDGQCVIMSVNSGVYAEAAGTLS